MPGPFASIGDVLKGLAPRLGLDARLLELRLKQQWEGIVGPQIARNARPHRIRFKKLHVLVASSVWVQQLAFLRPTLIQRLNEAAGGHVVSDVVIRVGDLSESQPEGPRRGQAADAGETVPPPADLVREAARRASAVRDEELRHRLTSVMAAALSLPTSPHAPRHRPDHRGRDRPAP